MYHRSYTEVLETGSERLRSQEVEAFQLMLERLTAAADSGPGSDQWLSALNICQQFWRILIRDISSDEAEVSRELQSNLISIGLWAIKISGEMIAGDRNDIQNLVEIHEILLSGLNRGPLSESLS